jgi:hypothetical protein
MGIEEGKRVTCQEITHLVGSSIMAKVFVFEGAGLLVIGLVVEILTYADSFGARGPDIDQGAVSIGNGSLKILKGTGLTRPATVLVVKVLTKDRPFQATRPNFDQVALSIRTNRLNINKRAVWVAALGIQV